MQIKNNPIIISLTTWRERIGNLPTVLDTIYGQTMLPDKVVLNLAYDEQIPDNIQAYLDAHCVEVYRLPDTKVYKKLIPTLRRYPDTCVIAIDDDWLYPEGMIADLVNTHEQYPNHPVSGNREGFYGLQCHCGCASLTKMEYFGPYICQIDEELMVHCPSDDLVYTYFCNKAGHPYVRSQELYFYNMRPYNGVAGYSDSFVNAMTQTWEYLEAHFGPFMPCIEAYKPDIRIAHMLNDVIRKSVEREYKRTRYEVEQKIWSSKAFRLGSALMQPLYKLKRIKRFFM